MSANSNGQISRRPQAGNPFSRVAGLLMSTLLVAVMTIWATSSPFSPLAPRSQQSDVETAYEPVPMLQKVKDAFALSESVLPSPSAEPMAYQVQSESPPALLEMASDVSDQAVAGELARLQETHTLQQEDRNAWLSFRRQDSLSVTKPVVRTEQPTWGEVVATDATALPEVHFASADPPPAPPQTDDLELDTVPRLPTQLSLAIDKESVKEEPAIKEAPPTPIATEAPPTRIATLPVPYQYFTPFGQNDTTNVVEFAPTLPQPKSWETGRY